MLNGNNVNECESLGELWENKLQITKLASECWNRRNVMITQWVGTWAFIRDSHFSLISFPVIKSSEMDLGNCTVDCYIGLEEMNTAINFFSPLSLSSSSLLFCDLHGIFRELFQTIQRIKLFSSFDISMACGHQRNFLFSKWGVIVSPSDKPKLKPGYSEYHNTPYCQGEKKKKEENPQISTGLIKGSIRKKRGTEFTGHYWWQEIDYESIHLKGTYLHSKLFLSWIYYKLVTILHRFHGTVQ